MGYLEEQDITLEMIMAAGLLKPDVKVYAAFDNSIQGTLNGDGSITLEIEGNIRTFPYPSGAARAIRNISVSGWIFWKVKEGDSLVDLLKFKERYKSQFNSAI